MKDYWLGLFAKIIKFIFYRDVLSNLSTTRHLSSSYQRIRSLATSPQNPELLQARQELETTLQDLSADLKDLAESVRAVEHDPYRYGLELDEVSRRRQLVQDVGREVEDMREDLQRTVMAKDKQRAAAAGGGQGTNTTGVLPSPSDFDENLLPPDERDDYYSEMEQQRQMEMMHEQDQQLDGVFRTVGDLRRQANDMGRELEDQTEMIKDVDALAERVGGKLQNGVRRVGHVIRRNEGKQVTCICNFVYYYCF